MEDVNEQSGHTKQQTDHNSFRTAIGLESLSQLTGGTGGREVSVPRPSVVCQNMLHDETDILVQCLLPYSSVRTRMFSDW